MVGSRTSGWSPTRCGRCCGHGVERRRTGDGRPARRRTTRHAPALEEPGRVDRGAPLPRRPGHRRGDRGERPCGRRQGPVVVVGRPLRGAPARQARRRVGRPVPRRGGAASLRRGRPHRRGRSARGRPCAHDRHGAHRGVVHPVSALYKRFGDKDGVDA